MKVVWFGSFRVHKPLPCVAVQESECVKIDTCIREAHAWLMSGYGYGYGYGYGSVISDQKVYVQLK